MLIFESSVKLAKLKAKVAAAEKMQDKATGEDFMVCKTDWDADGVPVGMSNNGDGNIHDDSNSVQTIKSLQFTGDGFEVAPTISISPVRKTRWSGLSKMGDEKSVGSRASAVPPTMKEDEEYDFSDDVSLLTSASVASRYRKSPHQRKKTSKHSVQEDYINALKTDTNTATTSEDEIMRAANSMAVLNNFLKNKPVAPNDDVIKKAQEDGKDLYTECYEETSKANIDDNAMFDHFMDLKARYEAQQERYAQEEMQEDMDNYDEMLNQLAFVGVDDSSDEEESNNHQEEVTVTRNFQQNKDHFIVSFQPFNAPNNEHSSPQSLNGSHVIVKDKPKAAKKLHDLHDKQTKDHKVARYSIGLMEGDDIQQNTDFSVKRQRNPKSILKSPKYSPSPKRNNDDDSQRLSLVDSYPRVEMSSATTPETRSISSRVKQKTKRFFGRSKAKSTQGQPSDVAIGNVGIATADVSSSSKEMNLRYVQPIIAFKNDGLKNRDSCGQRILPLIKNAPPTSQLIHLSSSYFSFAAYSLSDKAPKQTLLPDLNSNQEQEVDERTSFAPSVAQSMVSALTMHDEVEEDDLFFSPDAIEIHAQERGAIILMAFLLKKSCKNAFDAWRALPSEWSVTASSASIVR